MLNPSYRKSTVMLTAVMGWATFPQYGLGTLAPFIRSSLGLTGAGLGFAFAAMFAVAAAASPVAGWTVDRRPAHKSAITIFTLAATAIAALAMAPSLTWLIVAAALAGIPQAASNPLTNHVISERYPPNERGPVMGIKQSGGQLTWMVAGLTLPTLAVFTGWRTSLLVFSGVGLLFAPLSYRLLREASLPIIRAEPSSSGVSRNSSMGDNRILLRTLAVYGALMGGGMAVVVAYTPLYGFDEVGLGAAAAGRISAVLGMIALASRLLLGRLALRFPAHDKTLRVLAALAAIGTLCVVAASPEWRWLLWVGIVLIAVGGFGWTVTSMLALIDSFAHGQTGWASGRTVVPHYVAFVIAPPVFGVLVDSPAGYRFAWCMVIALFAGAALLRHPSRVGPSLHH